jgi:hypothetical protein
VKTIIFGAALVSLLAAGPAFPQSLGSTPPNQWVPVTPRPATFTWRDTTGDVDANVVRHSSWRLGEFTLLQRDERDVRLRFTLTGVPPPAIPAAAPRGQALATVAVDVIALPRR